MTIRFWRKTEGPVSVTETYEGSTLIAIELGVGGKTRQISPGLARAIAANLIKIADRIEATS